MSSPFHSLRKNKVPLFPGHMAGNRPIKFRHPDMSEEESKLLDEITNVMVKEKRKQDQLPPLPASLGTVQNSSAAQQAGSNVPSMLRRFGAGNMPPSGTGASVELGAAAGSSDVLDSLGPPPSDKELMRLMMNRIAVLEQTNKTQEEELRAKDKKLKILQDRLRTSETALREDGSGQAVRELKTRCLLLQQQVHEMETFLAEYGMVWVGDSVTNSSNFYIDEKLYDSSDNDDNDGDQSDKTKNASTSFHGRSDTDFSGSSEPFSMWRQDTSLASESGGSAAVPNTSKPPPGPLDIDFNLLIENIKDLNVLAGEGQAQIKKTSDGARFEVPESVQLTIYANGILMFDGPFRPYTDPTTRQCVQDLLDGYFPSELRLRYPDGVPFVVTDLRGTHYQQRAGPLAFTGEGQALGGDIGPSRLIPTGVVDQTKKLPLPSVDGLNATSQTQPTSETLATAPHHLKKPLTQAQFLNKLPKSVIRDGKVIDIRNSIGKSLSGTGPQAPSNVTLVNTSVTKDMSESLDASEDLTSSTEDRPRSNYRSHGDVTTLRVVTEQGAHTYIVKMKFRETIGNLRAYLDAQRRPTVPYDIVSTFPHKVHKNNNLTLEASGLTPNAVLHLKPQKP